MVYCKRCTFPAIATTHLVIDEEGICTGCRAAENKDKINWEERKQFFSELIEDYRTDKGYECIIPVSGGKDSYFAAHIAKEFGLNALMVTYHSNTFLEEAEYNLSRMKDLFGFDHEILHPDDQIMRKMHRVGFIKPVT